jgi:hypothetical protein
VKLDLEKVRQTFTLIQSLPGFFRRRISLQQAEQEIKMAWRRERKGFWK